MLFYVINRRNILTNRVKTKYLMYFRHQLMVTWYKEMIPIVIKTLKQQRKTQIVIENIAGKIGLQVLIDCPTSILY